MLCCDVLMVSIDSVYRAPYEPVRLSRHSVPGHPLEHQRQVRTLRFEARWSYDSTKIAPCQAAPGWAARTLSEGCGGAPGRASGGRPSGAGRYHAPDGDDAQGSPGDRGADEGADGRADGSSAVGCASK